MYNPQLTTFISVAESWERTTELCRKMYLFCENLSLKAENGLLYVDAVFPLE